MVCDYSFYIHIYMSVCVYIIEPLLMLHIKHVKNEPYIFLKYANIHKSGQINPEGIMIYLVPDTSSIVSYFPGEKIIFLNEILMFDTINCF